MLKFAVNVQVRIAVKGGHKFGAIYQSDATRSRNHREGIGNDETGSHLLVDGARTPIGSFDRWGYRLGDRTLVDGTLAMLTPVQRYPHGSYGRRSRSQVWRQPRRAR
jgi:hypothetical protein